jgi:DNA mismatch repair protein MutL
MLLPNEQMQEIVRMLEVADQPRTCPHGRPTIIRIGIKELDKEFLRK